jgi:molybdate transport system ATP-binding protein
MYELLAFLDLPRKRDILPYLERQEHDINIPILYVSHSIDEILCLTEQVMVLNLGKGAGVWHPRGSLGQQCTAAHG